MLKNRILLPCFFLVYSALGAQTLFTQNLEGKVVSRGKSVPDVHVMNITASRSTITDAEGYFSIPIRLNDTLLFSAVQFKRKTIVVNAGVLQAKSLSVPLEDFVNELDEVVVRPFDLSGDLSKDMKNMNTGRIISSSTLGLPNAQVKPLMQSERQLQQATVGKFSPLMILNPPLDPLINAISGRTKMLKKRVARDKKYIKTQELRSFYLDSLFVAQLKIPKDRIDDFLYFCEVDVSFDSIVKTDDTIKIWDFMLKKSAAYRENNDLD